MGDIADAILEGQTCQWCGEDLGDGDGYPVVCVACQKEHGVDQNGNKHGQEPKMRTLLDPRTIVCGHGKSEEFTGCQRKFRSEKDLAQHRRVKHG